MAGADADADTVPNRSCVSIQHYDNKPRYDFSGCNYYRCPCEVQLKHMFTKPSSTVRVIGMDGDLVEALSQADETSSSLDPTNSIGTTSVPLRWSG